MHCMPLLSPHRTALQCTLRHDSSGQCGTSTEKSGAEKTKQKNKGDPQPRTAHISHTHYHQQNDHIATNAMRRWDACGG